MIFGIIFPIGKWKHTLMTHKCTKLLVFESQKSSGKVQTPFNITACDFSSVGFIRGSLYYQPTQTMHYGNREIPQNSPYICIKFDAPPKMGDQFMTSHHINSHLFPWALDPPEPSRSVRPVRPLQLPLLPDHLGICGISTTTKKTQKSRFGFEQRGKSMEKWCLKIKNIRHHPRLFLKTKSETAVIRQKTTATWVIHSDIVHRKREEKTKTTVITQRHYLSKKSMKENM